MPQPWPAVSPDQTNETERRSAMFKRLKGSGLMPDGKVTRELAAKYKELRPLAAIFDEVQNVLTDKQHGDPSVARQQRGHNTAPNLPDA